MTGDKPPASTPRTPKLVVISPDDSPRRSPRFSPQREFTTHIPSVCVGARSLGADLAGFTGGERQQEEPPGATPNTPPPSTTRAPSTEPTRTEEEEVNLGGSGSIPATNVGGEGTTSSQLGTGTWPASYPCLFFFFIF